MSDLFEIIDIFQIEPSMRNFPLSLFGRQNRAERFQRVPRHCSRASNRQSETSYDSTDLSQQMMAKYRSIRPLKEGGMSAAINVVEELSTGKRYVEKQIAVDKRRGPKRVEAEIGALRQISQYGSEYNLNSMVQYVPGRRTTHIILEYCDGGDLQQATDRLYERGDRHPESFIWHVLVSCIRALDLLHKGPTDLFGRYDPSWNTICHLDIKPENIYLQDIGEKIPRVVLGDFGCSVCNSDIQHGKEKLSACPAWTPGWQAPEMIKGLFGTKTDSWQLGCTIQAICLLNNAPNVRMLESSRPCGSRYSRELNSFVRELTATDLYLRQNAEDMMDIAQQNLRRAMLEERR